MTRPTPRLTLVTNHWVQYMVCLFAGCGFSAQAQIAQDPMLTRAAAVEPNVVLMFDDSASMPTSTIYQFAGAPGPYGMSGPTVPNVQYAPDVNLMYYDPRYTFSPRLNADGTRQSSGVVSAVNSFPVYWRTCEPTASAPNNTCTGVVYTTTSVPLFNTAYLPSSGLLATGATALAYPITASAATSTYPKFKDRTDCTGNAAYCSWSEERQNYANWLTYHNTRLEMVKSALGEAFAPMSTTLRLGWGTINVIQTSSRLDSGVSLLTPSVKTNFYNWLYARTGPTASTPNRNALDKVGKYFSRADANGPWADAPLATSTAISAAGSAVNTHAACRRSYAILVTDGYWNDASAPSGLGNVDNTSATIANPNGAAYTYNPIGPYKDTQSGTLADVAMKYWITDLRTDLPNKVPSIPGVNESFWQNMSFYAISLGLDGTLAQTPATLTNLTSGATVWPTAVGDDPRAIDDMWHATINGRGQLLNAASTSTLSKAMTGMLTAINKQTSSQSGVAVSTANLTTGTRKYTPQYVTIQWTGNVIARNLDPLTGSEVSTAWQVETGKNATSGDPITTIPAAASRNIVVWNSATATPKTEPFTYTRLVASGLNSAMGTTVTSALVDYLRGEPSLEQRKTNGVYRNREARLGDIVNAAPVYIKNDVNLNYGALPRVEADSYAAYLNFKQARTEGVLFVGANDGMLHAFRDSNGSEVFAFIPRSILPNLYKLSDPAYVHQYLVDGPNVETDAYWGGAWKNILIGTTGAGAGASAAPFSGGAKAVYALDVTYPLAMDASKVLWEINPASTGFSEMGYVLSDVQAGQATDGTWIGVFGNGYASTSGTARLLVVNLQTGALYKEINTGVGNTTNKNGLGGVRLVRNAKQQIIGAYGGDLYGNVWKFDLSDNLATNWRVGFNGNPMFAAGSTQAITATPAVLPHPSGNGYVVTVGTGKFFENADLTTTAQQALYGIWDPIGFPINASVQSTGTSLGSTVNKSSLVQQTISAAIPITVANPDGSSNTVNYYNVSRNTVDWTTQKGWYINLTNTGQRVVYPVETVASPYISVDTISPTTAVSSDPCVLTGQGSGWLYFINGLTGAGPTESIFDTNASGNVDTSDLVNGLVLSGINTKADGRNNSIAVSAQSDATKTTYVTLSGGESSALKEQFSCTLLNTCQGGGTLKVKSREWRQLFMR